MQTQRKKIAVKAPQVVTFSVPDLPAMTDALFELDVGKHETNVQCCVPDFEHAQPRPYIVPDMTLTVYFSEQPLPKVTDYEFSVDVVRRGGTAESPKVMKVPMSSSALEGIFFGISSATNVFAIAFFSTVPLKNVSMKILVHHPIDPYDDIRQPWRICRLPYVSGISTDSFSDWLSVNRTKLILGLAELVRSGTGENLLHVLCGHLGDPRLGRIILKHCARFVKVNLRDSAGRTPLLALLQHKQLVCDPNSTYYRRCLELIQMLVVEGGAAADIEDSDGNTAAHFAAAGHRRGSEVLQLVLELGAPPDLRNQRGLTPIQLITTEDSGRHGGQEPDDSRDAVAILEARISELQQKRQNEMQSADGLKCSDPAESRIGEGTARIRPEDTNPPRVYVVPPETCSKFATPVIQADSRGLPAETGGIAAATLVVLQREFESLDEMKEGYISIGKMRRAYMGLEGYGVAESVAEIDKAASAMGIRRDGRVTFDEYCLLMLRINAR